MSLVINLQEGDAMVMAARTTSQILMHMGVAFTVMYVATGSAAFGGVAAVIEPICNVALLPLHDRAWERIRHWLGRSAEGRVETVIGEVSTAP
jgi:uncharacterized membrane protein